MTLLCVNQTIITTNNGSLPDRRKSLYWPIFSVIITYRKLGNICWNQWETILFEEMDFAKCWPFCLGFDVNADRPDSHGRNSKTFSTLRLLVLWFRIMERWIKNTREHKTPVIEYVQALWVQWQMPFLLPKGLSLEYAKYPVDNNSWLSKISWNIKLKCL